MDKECQVSTSVLGFHLEWSKCQTSNITCYFDILPPCLQICVQLHKLYVWENQMNNRTQLLEGLFCTNGPGTACSWKASSRQSSGILWLESQIASNCELCGSNFWVTVLWLWDCMKSTLTLFSVTCEREVHPTSNTSQDSSKVPCRCGSSSNGGLLRWWTEVTGDT